MPNGRTREPFRCRSRDPRTKNGRVFGPRTVCRARMAASNKLRVTPSHSMQPTTGPHRWHVHIPTYGRSVASKPAAIACDRGASPPAQATISSAPRRYIGHMSSQWHTRQPQPPEQLAAISWGWSHAQRTNERAVSVPKPRSKDQKRPCFWPTGGLWRPYGS